MLHLHNLVSSYFEQHSDVYCHVEVGVDPKKHVKPIEVRPQVKSTAAAVVKSTSELTSDGKFITVAKYSYYESGSKWIKVLLDYFKDIKGHPKEKITCEFKKRSFTLQILDYKGHNY